MKSIFMLLLLVSLCSGCGYSLVHKSEISSFRTLLREYRRDVKPKRFYNKDDVEAKADNMESILDSWER